MNRELTQTATNAMNEKENSINKKEEIVCEGEREN